MPRGKQSGREGPAKAGNLGWLLGESAVPDDIMRSRNGQVEHWSGDGVEPGFSAVQPNQSAAQPRTPDSPQSRDGGMGTPDAAGVVELPAPLPDRP